MIHFGKTQQPNSDGMALTEVEHPQTPPADKISNVALEKVEQWIRHNPALSLATGVVLGIAIGFAIKRRL